QGCWSCELVVLSSLSEKTKRRPPRRSKASFSQGGGVAYRSVPQQDPFVAISADGVTPSRSLQASCQVLGDGRNKAISIRYGFIGQRSHRLQSRRSAFPKAAMQKLCALHKSASVRLTLYLFSQRRAKPSRPCGMKITM